MFKTAFKLIGSECSPTLKVLVVIVNCVTLFVICVAFIKVCESGIPLQLVSFKESSRAIRLVPNTLELNEIIDRTLASIKRLSQVENNYALPIDGVYKHFVYKKAIESVSGVIITDQGILWGLTDLVRSGNAYIYNNEEQSIQVVTKFVSSQMRIEFEQFNLTIDNTEDTGRVDGTVDQSYVDVQITLRVRQNNSFPLVFVCDGKVDELSLTLGNVGFTITITGTGTRVYQELHSEIVSVLHNHLDNNIRPHLEKYLWSYLEKVIRRDEQFCYSLVLCNSCEFYAADF